MTWKQRAVGTAVGAMEQAGRPGYLAAIRIGIVLAVVGLVMFMRGLGGTGHWIRGLELTGLGVPFIAWGVAGLTGSQARLSSALESDRVPLRPDRQRSRDALATMEPPFGSCSACGHVVHVSPDPGRCPECLSLTAWLHSDDETGRSAVESNLG